MIAKQYLRDQFDKYIKTDPMDDNLKQVEKQTHVNKTDTNNDLLNNIQTGNSTSNTHQESTSNNNRNNVNQTYRRMNNEQKDSVNSIPLHKNIEEHNEKNDTCTRTRYKRIV